MPKKIRLKGQVRLLDKDGFDQSGRISSFGMTLEPGQIMDKTHSERLMPVVMDNIAKFDALFDVFINNTPIWKKKVPLSKDLN